MKCIGVLVVACGLLLAGCGQGVELTRPESVQSGLGGSDYELFFDGKAIKPSKYVRLRSADELTTLPEDLRYDLRRGLTQREFAALPAEKQRLLALAKPDPEPEPGSEKPADAYELVRSLRPESLALLPEEYKGVLLKRLSKEQLRALPQSAQSALNSAK